MNKITDTNIQSIRAGDTVLHNGLERTVCARDIKYNPFMGYSIFGDSYNSGHKPVKKINYGGK